MALLASVFKSCILEFRVISLDPNCFFLGCLSVPRFNRSLSGNGYLKTATTNVKCSQSQRCVSVCWWFDVQEFAGYPLSGWLVCWGCAKRRKRCKLLFLALTWLDVTHRFIVLLSLNTCVFSAPMAGEIFGTWKHTDQMWCLYKLQLKGQVASSASPRFTLPVEMPPFHFPNFDL